MKRRSITSVFVFIYLSTASVAVAPIQNLVTLEKKERMTVKTSRDAFSPHSFTQVGSQTRLRNGDKHDTQSAEQQVFTPEMIQHNEHTPKSKHSLK